MNFDLNISPAVSNLYGFIPVILSALLLFLVLFKGIRVLGYRCIFLAFIAILLLNPAIIKEIRNYLEDKVLVVVDNSASMDIGERKVLAEKVVDNIKNNLKNVEIEVVNSGEDLKNGTNLFASLKNFMSSLPLNRVSGSILITDGRVHDIPEDIKIFESVYPLNTVIVGTKDEFDRKLSIIEAPKYGLVGSSIAIKVRADIEGVITSGEKIPLKIEGEGGEVISDYITVGEEKIYEFKLEHTGQNLFTFTLDVDKKEITNTNNFRAITVNGVRDRLKVLLVSGRPHMGERAWRNLLRSDPAVDLVHFTILRTPNSFDPTSTSKMALIAFPVEELFQRKIEDFDLIIFDKYIHYGLLYDRYFTNIANYVKNGGSFLMAMDSERIEPEIFSSSLSEILPVSSHVYEQHILKGDYLPKLVNKEKFHAITSDLNFETAGVKKWKSQIQVKQTGGDLLLTGINENPLLIIDKVGKGRVAVLTSDNIWLWSKYPSSKGLYFDLQRKLAHWLMKEPELDEGYIKVMRKENVLNIAQRVDNENLSEMHVINPNGREVKLEMRMVNGWAETETDFGGNGVYRFYNEKGSTVFVAGNEDYKEFSDMTASDVNMSAVAEKTGGRIVWYDGKNFSTRDFNLHSKKAYQVSGMERNNLFPSWFYVIFLVAGFMYVWQKEG